MCLIVNFEPKYNISKELMDNFAKRNNDGFGLMWIQDNRLCHMKFGPDKMDQLYAMYESVKAYSGFLHLRMRTHGDTNQDMAHPFNCGFGIYMMHNGVLDAKGEDKSKSDTWYFVNQVLNPLFKNSKNPHKLFRSSAFSDLIHKYLGYNNRVVIGDRGGWQIFNSNSWYEIKEEVTGCKGMLVSNTYAWSEPTPKKSGVVVGGYYGHHQQRLASPAASNARLFPEIDDEDDYGTLYGRHVVERKPEPPKPSSKVVQDYIAKHFFFLSPIWCANAWGKVFKKEPEGGLTRHSELDENDKFWNIFDKDKLAEYGEWMAEQHNLELDTSKTMASARKRKPKASQLVLNWQNKSPDQIKDDMIQYPDVAAEAIVALTHEPVKSVQ
jgi:hypothetical protein